MGAIFSREKVIFVLFFWGRSSIMGKIITFLVFLAALVYVVLPPSSEPFRQKDDPKTLHFWGVYDVQEIYSPVIEAFEKTHPGFEIAYKQFSNLDEYHEVLTRQLVSGKGPDIFLFSDEKRGDYVPYINPTSSQYAEGFPEYVKEKLTTNRLLFGLPLWVDSLVLYYHKRYYPDGIAPLWHDFAEQTKKVSIGGIAMGRLDNIRSGWDMLNALFLQKEVKISGKPENAVYDVLEFYTRFAYPIDPYFNWNENLNRDYPDAEVDSFAREKVAAVAGYAPLYNFIITKSDQLRSDNARSISREEIGVAPFPQFSSERSKYLGKYYFLSVSLHSKYPNEAWEFIRLLTNETNAAYYQQATNRTPGRILSSQASDSALQQVQKQQLPQTSTHYTHSSARQKIEEVVARGLKDKRLLREILDMEL